MVQNNQLSDLGLDFQLDLFHELIMDQKFAETVINNLEVNYFKIEALQKIIFTLKNYYKQHETIPTFPNIRADIQMLNMDNTLRTQILDTLDIIEKRNVVNKNIQGYVTKFCRLKALKIVLDDISKKVDKGVVEEYDTIERKLKDVLIYKETIDPITLYHNLDNVLSDDYREPIPTGITGIDDITDNGIAPGELALVIAPLGVGKTTFLTKVANEAYRVGKNVLQIFFEDKEKAIQRKHYTIMTEIPLSDISKKENFNLIRSRLKAYDENRQLKNMNNNIFLQKLPADGVTISQIKNIIKKLNSQGNKIDLLVLDYIDCITLEKEYQNASSDEWGNEGKIMRLLETMIEEVGVACWTATQGNRASTSAEIVRTENMGGSLKKAQIAHFIASIGKTLEQKEQKVATISILKNRLGPDGMIYPNCKFDNGTLEINTSDQITEKGFEDKKTLERLAKQRELFKANNSSDNQ